MADEILKVAGKREKMKKAKIITIWVFTIIMLANLLFVPWIFISKHERNRNTVRQAGYALIFESPEIPGVASSGYYTSGGKRYEGFPVQYWSVQIDRYRLIAQSFAILVLFCAVYFTINFTKRVKD